MSFGKPGGAEDGHAGLCRLEALESSQELEEVPHRARKIGLAVASAGQEESLGAFDALEPAVYFALVSFTTAGFGDITLGPDWRLLSGLTAANGFLMFGWSTAYMVELMRRTA